MFADRATEICLFHGLTVFLGSDFVSTPMVSLGIVKHSADLGIVITENTNNFVPACDAISDATNFARLPAFFHYFQQTVRVVYLAYVLALCYNLIGLSYAVTGTLSPVIAAILMPLSSISVVLFGVLSSRFLYQLDFEKSHR